MQPVNQPAEPPPTPPRTAGGTRVLRRLGGGGMGDVYLGYDPALRRALAVKVLAERFAADPVVARRFRREARLAQQLDHPNLVRCLGYGREPGTGRPFLKLDYVEGGDAQRLIDRAGRLSVRDAVRVALDVARALEFLHGQRLVHRDVKPSNVLLTADGRAKLADLGLAKRLDDQDSRLTATDAGFGTSHYMPYEQALNPTIVDGRSDLFALGATLYHLLTGEPPYDGPDHEEITRRKEEGRFVPAAAVNPEVPAGLDALLSRLLARDPRRRFATAGELAAALEATGLAGHAGPLESAPKSGVVSAGTDAPTRPNLGQVRPRSRLLRAATAVRRSPWPYAGVALLLAASAAAAVRLALAG